jgi:adenine-specific DNA-methyltransferase
MKQKEAKKIIIESFNSSFNEETFLNFVSNLLKKYQPVNSTRDGQYIKEAFRDFVIKYKIAGYFEDAEGNEIDVLQVALKKSFSLERARTAQRNFIAEYLKTNNKEAAIVAFISTDKTDWRLSLVKLESSLKVVNNKLKVKEEITPAKRWSFLVGKNEGSHTAQSRFVDLLTSDEKPTLNELEKAFDIETVTKEFFNKYKELFLKLKEHLDEILKKDKKIKQDFQEKEITTVDFAKKTLGQIVFLYFLQKKGWFGVASDKKWGEGPKNFIRELFNRREKYGNNFFNDVLEPLFYEALAQDRGRESIYPRLNNCRMPFLNGGLFEPMNGYKWETTDIIIPDDIFSNKTETKEGDTGTGILDVFDRYNFTVNENEPLEKEVAVDPEMLGKVFENLLDIKDRKSKGSFYTPREIVHYMCQESLINYLETETKKEIPREDLEIFIHKGDRIIENDQITLNKIKEKENKGYKYEGSYKLILPVSIRENAEILDNLLKEIKIADPAVGSGAFPLGMINEIVRARKVLNIYFNNNVFDYKLKKYTITHSIYGVDLDPGAVEIAKLRLWLALVVDEKNPHPLPNLEHKIMQGNSLISEYEGIKLFDQSFIEGVKDKEKEEEQIKEKISQLQKEYFKLYEEKDLNKLKDIEIKKEIKSLQKRLKNLEKDKTIKGKIIGLFDKTNKQQISQEKAKLLQKKTEEFINESRPTKKQNLKKEIDDLKWELIETTLEEQDKLSEKKLKELRNYRKTKTKPFFIWQLEFCDVFIDKGGFDVVIGNPPYIKEYTAKKAFNGLRNSPYYMGKMDLWYFFACYGLDLLKEHGVQAFIAPNNWISNFGAKLMREKLLNESVIHQFIDFGNYKVFDTAGIQTMVYILEKNNQNADYRIKFARLKTEKPSSEELTYFLKTNFEENNDKFEKFIFNFRKEGFIGGSIQFLNSEIDIAIDKIKIGENIFLTNKEVAQGIVLPQDFLNKKNQEKLGDGFKTGDGIFGLSKEEKDNLNLSNNEKEIVKPYFMTPNFYKYGTNSQNAYWIIYTDSKFKNPKEIEKYPNLKKHLDQFKEVVTSDNKPYGLHRARDEKFFKGEKIVVARKCIEPSFSYSNFDCYVSATFYVIKTQRVDMKYLTAILNSNVVKFWLKYKGKMQGNNFQVDKEPLVNIPIKKISPEDQKPFINLVDQILEITFNSDYDPKNPPAKQKELESQIDQLVYKLYDLTKEEIKIVEEN